MKKVFLFTTTIVLLTLVVTSCKKDKAQTTAQKVQHNWTLISIIDNEHDASGDNIDTSGITGDFMNFNVNGAVAIQIEGMAGSASYSITSNTEILLATQTYTIKTLTDTQLVLYAKEVISSTDYDEETINLKR